jgi:non-ribosomal peptide synthetase component F
VKAARASELRAFDHATVPFEDVVADLAAESSEARHPIFQVALSLDVFATQTLTTGDVHVEITPQPIDIAKCDLHFHVTERRDDEGKAIETTVDIVYPTALFDENTVTELGRRFEQILTAAVAEPDSAWRNPATYVLHDV